jgi:LPXTG-motif cell wall-anchored protein
MAWRRALVILAAAAAGVLLVASPAAADTDLTLNPDHQDETAAGFTQDCTAPFSSNMTEDGWHFLWPKGGDFTSLTATFTNGGAPFNVTVTSTDVNNQSGNGTTWHGYIDDTGSGDFKHVYLFTQPGWTLVDATGTGVDGETTGDNLTQFNLSHTCAAKTSTPSPSPSASPSPTTSASPATSGSTDPGTPTTPSDDRLPTTGVALTGLVAAGIGLIAGGATLLFLRRRRDQPTA